MARKAVKTAKQQEKADKAAAWAAQKEACNTEKAIQLSQKGKRKASRSHLQSNKHARRVGDGAAADEAAGAAPAPPAVTTRCGRNITLPSKYK